MELINIRLFFIIATLLLVHAVVSAQAPPAPGDPQPELPIDNGIPFLMISGLLLAIYVIRKKKKTPIPSKIPSLPLEDRLKKVAKEFHINNTKTRL
ncbi:hypothetical protein OIU80_17770 [Flavobacterium sp. LS1R47]|jgi:hypothetical protein|uniref:Uncharacterized protein n=1 Tax=Flavobacterium frigoritolerans TaxID=2987686 RepID=A0A9X3HMV4_9FLAO|nr:hypothetical protein [Flavobacterium frigoritolerans]MCV9934134.1 hypothetical protein [Flavobacterium frigoritolerans]